jgi:hypothetical protein
LVTVVLKKKNNNKKKNNGSLGERKKMLSISGARKERS